MQIWRCACGKSEWCGSMSPAPCSRCSSCGTSGLGPRGEKAPPERHQYVTRYDERTGAPYERCRACLQTRARLRDAGEDDAPIPDCPDASGPNEPDVPDTLRGAGP